MQDAETAGLHAAVLRCASQPGWDIKERALLALEALLSADTQNKHVLDSLSASTKLQSAGSWTELEDEGYREEMQQLQDSVLSKLTADPKMPPPDEL